MKARNSWKRWFVLLLGISSILIPIVLALIYFGIAYLIKADLFGVQPNPSEIREANKFIVIGLSLLVAGGLYPYKNRKRFLTSSTLVTVFMWWGIISDGGQEDQFFMFALYMAITVPLYFLHQKLKLQR